MSASALLYIRFDNTNTHTVGKITLTPINPIRAGPPHIGGPHSKHTYRWRLRTSYLPPHFRGWFRIKPQRIKTRNVKTTCMKNNFQLSSKEQNPKALQTSVDFDGVTASLKAFRRTSFDVNTISAILFLENTLLFFSVTRATILHVSAIYCTSSSPRLRGFGIW